MRFYEYSDYPMIKSWYEARKVAAPGPKDFPKCGLIVDEIVAGFMIQTDVPYAQFDFFISNPESTEVRRDRALEHLVQALEQLAREKGYKGIWCNTRLDAIAKRKTKLRYQEHGLFRVFSKEL